MTQAKAALLGAPLMDPSPTSAPVAEDDSAVIAAIRAQQLRRTHGGRIEACARHVGTWIDAPEPMDGSTTRVSGWLNPEQKISEVLKERQAKAFLAGAASDAQKLATIEYFVERGAFGRAQGKKLIADLIGQSLEKTVVEAAFECRESDVTAGVHRSAALELHSDGGAALTVTEGPGQLWIYTFVDAAEESDENTLRLRGTCKLSGDSLAVGETVSFWLEFLSESGGWRGLVGAPDSDPAGIGGRWEAEFAPMP